MIKNFKFSRPFHLRIYQACWEIVRVMLFSFPLFPNTFRIQTLRLFGAKIGAGVVIKPSVYIKLPYNLNVDGFSWLGNNVWLDNDEMITLGEDVCISQFVKIITGNHDYLSDNFKYFGSPVVIQNNCWITADCLILGGSTISSNCVLGPRSTAYPGKDNIIGKVKRGRKICR